MLVFLATPYSQLCDENYRVKEEYYIFFKKLTDRIKKLGVDYFLAMERENFGKEYTSDRESTNIDYNLIKKSDLVCAIPGTPASGGVHVELGWASSNNRKIVMFLNKDKSYSPMVTGLGEICDVAYCYYDKEYSSELIEKICYYIEKMKEEKDYE